MSSSNNVFPKFLTLKQRQNIKITKPKKHTSSLSIIGATMTLESNYDEYLDSPYYLDQIEEEYYSTINNMRMVSWPDMD